MRRLMLLLVVGAVVCVAAPAPASASNPVGALCGAAGAVSKLAAIPCTVAKHAGAALKVGKRLVGSGSAVGAVTSVGGAFVIGALAASVLGAAQFTLDETVKVLGATTRPNLRSTWFSGTYWRMAGIAAVLTLPFLFAAAVQALLRSDLALLARAALLHLPLALLAVSIAAPLTMLLLAASDELSSIVSSATGHESAHFLSASAFAVGGLSALSSPFLAFLVGAFTVAGALALWTELLMRETAVYVIVLMLPLTFAAFVWPARRIWAVRTVEILFALILSKFAIVAVLSLGGAALNTSLGTTSVVNWLAGLVLVVMASFMPWALLRFVPLTELASAAAGSLRGEVQGIFKQGLPGDGAARTGYDWASRATSYMRRQAQEVRGAGGGDGDGNESAAPADGVAPADPPDEAAVEPPGEGGSALGAEQADAPASEPGPGRAPGESAPPRAAEPDPTAAPTASSTIPAQVAGGPTASSSWKPDILQLDDDTHEVVLRAGEVAPRSDVGARRDRTTAPPDAREASTADDPDPLPQPQPPPEGSL